MQYCLECSHMNIHPCVKQLGNDIQSFYILKYKTPKSLTKLENI